MATGKHTRRPGALFVALAIAGILVATGVVGTGLSLSSNPKASQHQATAKDMHGRAVVLDPNESPIPTTASHPQTQTGDRLIVASVGLSVPLDSLNAVDGQITPPGFTSAYWVRNMGVSVADGTQGTVFVVMHSLRGGGLAPGNYLANVRTQTARVSVGAAIHVDGISYSVTGSELVAKTALARDATVWANTPNRLLLITCLENANGSPSTHNLIVEAQRNA